VSSDSRTIRKTIVVQFCYRSTTSTIVLVLQLLIVVQVCYCSTTTLVVQVLIVVQEYMCLPTHVLLYACKTIVAQFYYRSTTTIVVVL
jgi:hypothetical protein